ncbi:unnamed protein product, partial [Laminaria digitata]
KHNLSPGAVKARTHNTHTPTARGHQLAHHPPPRVVDNGTGMAHHLAAAAGAAVQYRRAPSIAHRTQDDLHRASSSQHTTSSSRLDLSSSVESDLCCMEDGWDKESPAPANP